MDHDQIKSLLPSSSSLSSSSSSSSAPSASGNDVVDWKAAASDPTSYRDKSKTFRWRLFKKSKLGSFGLYRRERWIVTFAHSVERRLLQIRPTLWANHSQCRSISLSIPYLRASHSKKIDFLLVPLTQHGVKKIMKMTVFLFSKFLHLPFLFWP